MEELVLYASNLIMEIDELQGECDSIIEQRIAMMQAWDSDDVAPEEIASRIQTIDALLSTNFRIISDYYAELKRVDGEIGWCLANPPEEEFDEDEEDDY